MRTFLFPVSGFCYYKDICVIRKQKYWVDKSAKKSYHNKTTLKGNIAPHALALRYENEIFRTEKCLFSHNSDNNELLMIMIIITK